MNLDKSTFTSILNKWDERGELHIDAGITHGDNTAYADIYIRDDVTERHLYSTSKRINNIAQWIALKETVARAEARYQWWLTQWINKRSEF